MHTGLARLLASTLTISCWVAACAAPEPPAAPQHHEAAPRGPDVQREQRALEHRRLRLEYKVLAELRKLRDSRQASTGAAEPSRDDAAEPDATDELLLFGGANREVFLGCLCDEHRPDSVFNMLGEHGSHQSGTSIRNKFAAYGSNHDDTSACNTAATHPPVVLASDGKSVGLLTLNATLKRSITVPSVTDWLARMCGE
jgi:hypothetical protein